VTPVIAPTVVYILCLLASSLCAGLLLRAYFRSRTRLLLWTALSFVCLALNNFFLVGDLVIFPGVNLSPLRPAASLAAIGILLYGFIWEAER
jgi:hypothetical protein